MAIRVNPELLFDENGNIEKRFLPLDHIVVPTTILLSDDEARLEVEDEEAYWHEVGEERQVFPNVLYQFIRLSEQSPARILQFARRWGLLGLCEHGLPATHHVDDRDGQERVVLIPYGGCTPAPAESIVHWRTYSSRFRTFIETAQRLHRGETIADGGLWDIIGRPYRGYFIGGARNSLSRQKQRFARAVNIQLAASGIQPVIHWNRGEPVVGFGVFGVVRTSLFSALAMQLALTVTDCKVAICSGCHTTYRPQRRTHAGQMNYCVDCRNAHVDVKARVQRLRDRRRAECID